MVLTNKSTSVRVIHREAVMHCKACGQPLPEKGDERDVWFEAAWDDYNKKVDKVAARRAWRRLTLTERSLVFGDLTERKWPDPTFKPNFATYLNHRRWEDEVPVVAPDPNSGGLARRSVQEAVNGQARVLSNGHDMRGVVGIGNRERDSSDKPDTPMTPEQRKEVLGEKTNVTTGVLDGALLRHPAGDVFNGPAPQLTPEQRAVNIARLGSILDGLGKIL
jgi:hypothetical protein